MGFDLRTLALSGFVDGNQVQIDGDITSLTLHGSGGGGGGDPVPEPATLLLTVSGLAALAKDRGRRASERWQR